jgi:hypothetical protein
MHQINHKAKIDHNLRDQAKVLRDQAKVWRSP